MSTPLGWNFFRFFANNVASDFLMKNLIFGLLCHLKIDRMQLVGWSGFSQHFSARGMEIPVPSA